MTPAAPRRLPVAVFASGGGSNFQALLDHAAERGSEGSWEATLLITDRLCGAEERAEAAGVAVRRVPVSGRPGEEVAAEVVAALEAAGIEAIFLAGYLRLVPPPVVQRWSGRILNVHPALLPAFGGKGMWGRHVHQAVLDSGARLSGPTVHLVDEAYDEGCILAQWPVAVRGDDTPETLAARVLEVEHRLYPRVADHLCRALLADRRPQPLFLSPGHFAPADNPGP